MIYLTEKIELEHRHRNQTYSKLNYLLSTITYFDFFSYDAFKISELAKKISKYSNKNTVTLETLILSFLIFKNQLSNLLLKYNLNTKSFLVIFPNYLNHVNKLNSTIKNNTNFLDLNEITFSDEVLFLFKKAAENAGSRFKTPVITSEILFLTILESNNLFMNRNLDSNAKINWYTLRYKLLKQIHKEEALIREKVIINQHYFLYLLKTQFSENTFRYLIKTDLLSISVSIFRNLLMGRIFKLNIINILIKDIYKLIKLNKNRKYTV